MKKILLSALLIGVMGGCVEPTVKAKSTKYTVSRTGGEPSKPLQLVDIEGCQYFVCDVYDGVVLCHKGNCKNIIHPEHTRR